MYKLLAIITMGLFAAACDGQACTTNVEAGVNLTVYEGNTENQLCGVTGMLIDGEYIEDIVIADRASCSSTVFLAWERKGEYQIILEKDGYKTWTSDLIKVTADSCHVRTVYVKANMEKM